ncbi:hypothetical protein CB0940_02126 [Cercospora beticola]|uniref:Methyltransferase domain-containing protein n=1 Tax=Cercospora beticola TaxID=122368 RepID=A0A2G5I857_CERBT|nr:hypothetical protein CB0940_02126 [Cercospora beticola]PIB00981.1 hypothetical protein CB0940_02126 [Cercospora beticola]WPA97744.1 hypothetical protein RHO25_002355 [Cercospora beticola]
MAMTSSNDQEATNSIDDRQRQPTYHHYENAQYALPNDSAEHQRLDRQAEHLSAMMHGKILYAPVNVAGKDVRILDVGCGTGVVTDLISSSYPEAECIGLDLSQVPASRVLRANTRFFKGDFCSEQPSLWTPTTGGRHLSQSSELFDYIFLRLLVCGMINWPEFIKKEFSLLKSGGWAEIQDLNFVWYDGHENVISQNWKWHNKHEEICKQKGMDLKCGSKVKDWMNDAGFVDVQTFEYSCPSVHKHKRRRRCEQWQITLRESCPMLCTIC